MTANNSKQHVGIIGCGASGLVTLKELHAEGHTGIIFERTSSIGGIFNTVYQQGFMVSSTIITMFSDFLGSEGDHALTNPRMLSFVEYSQYLNEYAKHFGLNEHIRLEHNVLLIQRLNAADDSMKWRVHVLDTRTNTTLEYVFDRLVVCSGTHQMRAMPTFKGINLYKGAIKHMQDVKKFEDFSGKRVCVVGSGEAAADMALAAAKHGSQSFISIRREHGFIIPRYPFGRKLPADLRTNRARYSIPLVLAYIQTVIVLFFWKIVLRFVCSSDHVAKTERQAISMNWKQLRTCNFRTTYGTKNTGFADAIVNYGCQLKPAIAELREFSVIFTDGTEESIDEIVCCTGFDNHFSFLNANHDDELIQRVTHDACTSHNLYKHMIHPLLGASLVFIGFVRPCFGAIPPLSEMQARWFALLCSDKSQLPDAEMMMKQSQTYVRYIEHMLTPYRTHRITNLTDFITYSDDLARLIGCRPDLGLRTLLSEPRLWWRCMVSPICNAQYRLIGPHAQPKVARRTIYMIQCPPPMIHIFDLLLLSFAALLWLCGVRRCKPLTWYPIDEWEA